MEANAGAVDPGLSIVAAKDDRNAIPLFEPRPGGPAERFAAFIGDRHPVVAFFLALISGYLLLAAASIALGFLVTKVLLSIDGVERLDERFPRWVAGERTDGWTDASWVGVGALRGIRDPRGARARRGRDGRPAQVADRRVRPLRRRRRVRDLPRDDALRRAATARGRAPRVAPRRRQLSVRPHGRVDRAVLRARAPRSRRGSRAGRGASPSGRSRSRSRRSWRCRGSTEACTTRSTSSPGSRSASRRSSSWSSRAASPARRSPGARKRRSPDDTRRGRRACRQVRRRRARRAPARPRGGRRRRSALVRGAEEPQGAEAGEAGARGGGRARLRLGRRRHGAALHRRPRGHRDPARDRPRGNRQSAGHEPRHPGRYRGSGRRPGCAARGARSTSAG